MKTFTYLMLIIAILACVHRNNLHVDGGVRRELNSEEQLAKELKPIEALLNEMVNHTIKNENRIEVRGRIVGKLKALARRAIKADGEREDLLIKQGRLKYDMDNLERKALRVAVIPYILMKLELYQDVWDIEGTTNSEGLQTLNFDIDEHHLDEQSRSNFKANTEKWDRILLNAVDPGAVNFKNQLIKAFPGVPLLEIAKHIGLAMTLLNNAEHGIAATDAGMNLVVNPEKLVKGLVQWNCLKDPKLLKCIKTFEEVTTGVTSKSTD